jgi:hypothetical protein
MWAFFAALPPGEFPDTVELAALLARISTEDQFQFGIRTFLAGLNAQSKLKAAPPPGPPPPLLACADTPVVEQLQQAANLRRLNVRRRMPGSASANLVAREPTAGSAADCSGGNPQHQA